MFKLQAVLYVIAVGLYVTLLVTNNIGNIVLGEEGKTKGSHRRTLGTIMLPEQLRNRVETLAEEMS